MKVWEALDLFASYYRKPAASKFIPLTHVVDLLQGLWIGDPLGKHLLEIVVLAGLLVVGVAVSARAFRWE